MLPIEQIIPFIRHDDPLVADLAIHCLKEVRWPHRLNGDFVLAAIEQGHPRLRQWLSFFTPTASVLAYTIECLQKGENESRDLWQTVVIANAPDELFTPQVIAAVRDIKEPFDLLENRTHHRLEMLSWPTERLQERFLAACERANEVETTMSDYTELMSLVDRLAGRPESHPWALEQFNRWLGKGDWYEISLFKLLAQARQRSVLDAALTRFPQLDADEDEALIDTLTIAIGELCQAADAPRLGTVWDFVSGGQRSYFISAISDLRFEEAEPLLLRIARETIDTNDQTIAVAGLCEMICTSDEAREFVRDIVDREAFDITFDDLEERAIPLGIIQGKPFAEEARWRERLSDPEQRIAARRAQFGRFDQDDAEPENTEYDEALERLAAFDEVAKASPDDEDGPPDVIRPIVAQQKVGRNDPCPCGSGKKYKKCCLK